MSALGHGVDILSRPLMPMLDYKIKSLTYTIMSISSSFGKCSRDCHNTSTRLAQGQLGTDISAVWESYAFKRCEMF